MAPTSADIFNVASLHSPSQGIQLSHALIPGPQKLPNRKRLCLKLLSLRALCGAAIDHAYIARCPFLQMRKLKPGRISKATVIVSLSIWTLCWTLAAYRHVDGLAEHPLLSPHPSLIRSPRLLFSRLTAFLVKFFLPHPSPLLFVCMSASCQRKP
jgi:hypothetical protein